MSKYDDIINRPHHRSKTHPHMPLIDRAAQFAPFAALTGYGDAIDETARITDIRPDLDEQQLAELNERLLQIMAEPNAVARITYFVSDGKKEGGRYEQAEGVIRKIDEYRMGLRMDNDIKIPLSDVLSIDIKKRKE